MKELDVFVLTGPDGKLLPPAVQATVGAKYSRSPLSAREIVQSVTPEDAEAFQEKWGVSYGHSSVAELAAMPYSFEGVSIIASKFLERYQRAGYSEKSTRYQSFSADSFVMPNEFHPALRDAAHVLYHTYKELNGPVVEHVARLVAKTSDKSVQELLFSSAVKARAFDNLRYLLPAGTGTNLMAYLNARDARYMMSDLLGSTNPEFQAIGQKMVVAAKQMAPVFAMGVKPNSFELPIKRLSRSDANPDLRLPKFSDSKGKNQWSVGLLTEMRHGPLIQEDFWGDVDTRHEMNEIEFGAHMETRGKNPVPEIFKTVPISFEITMDYGAFRDLQRHRRCEQYVELLGPNLGYLVPDDLIGTEFESAYRSAMDRAQAICQMLLESGAATPEQVQYACPLGFLHRSLFQMDLRELYYVVELRTQPQGHISYRRVAYRMYELAKQIYPTLMPWCRAVKPDSIGEHK